jgi:threonine dehydrogenase-like Zn-dependent dehydrogenase
MEALCYLPKPGIFSLESNVKVPEIVNEDDVLVEVHFAGLCGTDIHIVQVQKCLICLSISPM